MPPHVVAVHADATHRVSKPMQLEIRLLEGRGVEGDAHCGATVRHRYLARRDPTRPNLRQVHLIAAELFEELGARGFRIAAGQMGENVTTRGLDLLALPSDTELALGHSAVIRLTGLRNPCVLLDRLQPGLMSAVLDRDANGDLARKAGVMAVVVKGGVLQAGDRIEVGLPRLPHRPLRPV